MVAPPALRIVFFGTPDFALRTLDALIDSPHQVVGVVTQPDRPRGRGHQTVFSPVKARAVSLGLPVLQPDRLKDAAFLQALAACSADLGVVAAYGRILTDQVLGTPRLGMVNVHGSLLPKYRGAAPIARAVIAGEPLTGVTIMRVVQALDAGAMLATGARPIGPEETSVEVERDLAQLGAELLRETVNRLAAGHVAETPQDERLATYAPRLSKSDGMVDWSQPAVRIHNLIRGLHPWPHASTFLFGRRLILRRSTVVGGADAGPAPGTVLEAAGDRFHVGTGAGVIQLEEIQAENKRPMRAREFLAGHHVPPGARLSQVP